MKETKKKIKAVHIALACALIAMVVTGINMFVFGFGGTQIAIFCCMAAIFCTNLASYSSEKKKNKEKDTDSDKDKD